MKSKWYAVMMDREDNDWGYGSSDRDEAERMVISHLDKNPDAYIAVIVDDVCAEEIFPADFNGVVIGKWQNTDIDVAWIDGTLYALNGWNGEKYLHCWKCVDRFTADPGGAEYEIAPVYDWSAWNEDDGEFQDADGNAIDGIAGYEVL